MERLEAMAAVAVAVAMASRLAEAVVVVAAAQQAAESAGSPLAGTARAVKLADAVPGNAQRYSRIAADKSLRNFEARNRRGCSLRRRIERSVLALNRLSAPIR